MEGNTARTVNQHFRINIIRDSLIPKNKQAITESDLVIEFSELPENLTLQKSASYTDEYIPGRSEPWKTYSMSNATLIDFSAKLVAQGTENGSNLLKRAALNAGSIGGQLANKFGVGFATGALATNGPRVLSTFQSFSTDKTSDSISATVFDEVHKKAAVLESLTYPQYNKDGIAFPPPLIILTYGANFNRRGVVKDVRLQYKKPWVPETGLAMVIECNVVIEEVNEVPKSHLQVRNFQNSGTGMAGQVNVGTPPRDGALGMARSIWAL